MTNIIRQKRMHNSTILSPTGMGGYGLATGLGGEVWGMCTHTYMNESGNNYFYLLHTCAHTYVKIGQFTILTSKSYTGYFPKRKWRKTSPHQGIYGSILITKYACRLHIHRHVGTSCIYICTYVGIYVKGLVLRGKTCT